MGKSYARGRDNQGADIMISARVDLELMKMAVKELKTLEEKARPQKMDVSSVATPTTLSHEEWVAWMELQGEVEYEEEHAAAEASALDAIGGKAKGQSKTGKTKGKGKGKDKDGGRPAWSERRACHDCGVVGHMIRDCPAATKGKVSAMEESEASLAPTTRGTIASFVAKCRAVGCGSDREWRSVGAHGVATVDQRAEACKDVFEEARVGSDDPIRFSSNCSLTLMPK